MYATIVEAVAPPNWFRQKIVHSERGRTHSIHTAILQLHR
jgi:hypothetical protein